jgi:hypothetical protein
LEFKTSTLAISNDHHEKAAHDSFDKTKVFRCIRRRRFNVGSSIDFGRSLIAKDSVSDCMYDATVQSVSFGKSDERHPAGWI